MKPPEDQTTATKLKAETNVSRFGAFVHSDLDDAQLDPYQFRVWGHLCRRANKLGHAWGSQSDIMRVTGIGERKVREVLKSLEQRGWLQRQKRRRQDGSRTSDLVVLKGIKVSLDQISDIATPESDVLKRLETTKKQKRAAREAAGQQASQAVGNYESNRHQGRSTEEDPTFSFERHPASTPSEEENSLEPQMQNDQSTNPIDLAIEVAVRLEPDAQGKLFSAIRVKVPNASHPAFCALWAFLASPSNRSRDESRWLRCVTRISYWLELPEAFVLEVIGLARSGKGVFSSSLGACESWLEDPASAVRSHPHLAPLLDTASAASATPICGPGRYRTMSGKILTVLEIADSAVSIEGFDSPIHIAQTQGWVRA
jgi:DNA-binding MarR family transcriptional regulator